MKTLTTLQIAEQHVRPGNVEHFAILEFVSVHIPGDERSRTNPGHGYPASDEYYTKYHVFESQAELEDWISNRSNRDKPYIVLAARRLGVKTKIDISFE